MAYVGHSPVREFRDLRSAIVSVASPALVVKSALVAVAAAVAILALSDGGAVSTAAPQAVAAKKADRLAAPQVAASQVAGGLGGYTHDAAARTTTVERGAVTPLSPDSPAAVSGR